MIPDHTPHMPRLVAVAAVFYALCWLLPNHHMPWADFYSDAWAGCAMWGLAAVVLWHNRQERAWAWHALPLLASACMVIIWLQYAAGLIDTLGMAWTGSLYLMGLLLALVLGAAWEQQRPRQGADFLFMAALIGASGSLLIQLQQWLQINPGSAFWLFLPAPPSRFAGNLGQPNQLASLLCLGVLACAWLHGRHHLPGWVAWTWAALLAVGLALTESRTSWVVVLLTGAALLAWRKSLAIPRPLMIGGLSWAGFFALCTAALPYVNLWIGDGQLRAVRTISSNELRFEMWAFLWEAILQRPWKGYGWMQTSYAQFSADPYQLLSDGTMRHAHNLVLDLGTWLGIPLGLIVCAVLVLFFIQAARRIQHTEQLWMLLFVLALGVHALLEYPLYYAYFLLPIGWMLGLLTVALQFKPMVASRIWVVALVWILAGAGLVVTARDYSRIEDDFFSLRFERQYMEPAPKHHAPDVLVLTHLQDVLWLARIDPSQVHTEQDLSRALRTTKLLPSVMAMYKLAAMFAFTGHTEQAQYWVTVLTRLNRPSEKLIENLRSQWNAQAIAHPAMAQVEWPQ